MLIDCQKQTEAQLNDLVLGVLARPLFAAAQGRLDMWRWSLGLRGCQTSIGMGSPAGAQTQRVRTSAGTLASSRSMGWRPCLKWLHPS